jgi:hypothetical protein
MQATHAMSREVTQNSNRRKKKKKDSAYSGRL